MVEEWLAAGGMCHITRIPAIAPQQAGEQSCLRKVVQWVSGRRGEGGVGARTGTGSDAFTLSRSGVMRRGWRRAWRGRSAALSSDGTSPWH